MASTLFKRLCNIDFWHAYYLPEQNGTPYFELAPAAQLDVRKQAFYYGRYQLANDWHLEALPATKTLLKNYRLKVANKPQGLIIGCDVKAQTAADGSVRYFPRIPLPADLKLHFGIGIRNAAFHTFTNGRFRMNSPRRYYFTNEDANSEKIFPYLCRPTAAYRPNYSYEMGEAAQIAGQRRIARRTTQTDNAADWLIADTPGLFGEADRLLLPLCYRYQLPQEATNISFQLVAEGNNIGQALTFNPSEPTRVVNLDWQKIADALPTGESLEDRLLTLQISADSLSWTEEVVLSSTQYQAQYWGGIAISVKPDGGFPLVESDGSLLTYLAADGSTIAPPRLEVRLDARRTIWRYRSRIGAALQRDPAGNNLQDALEIDGRIQLVTPQAFSFQPTTFQALDSGNNLQEVLLPSPTPDALSQEDGQYISDIYIDKINNLITIA